MTRCKRCGTAFDYEKREGVCPKCCFYNRMPGAWQEAEEWISNYNVEDNSYELPKSLVEQEQKDKHSFYTGQRDWEKGNRKNIKNRNRTIKAGDNSRIFQKAILILPVLVILAVVIMFSANLPDIVQEDTSSDSESFEVNTLTPEEGIPEEIGVGDLIYHLGEAKVLFQEGELQDLPAGEKCIGIWIEDDRSTLDYEGYDWETPYVYDGSDYREIVDVDSLADVEQFSDMDIFPTYFSYDDGEGYAIFFVKEDAASVTLSLPGLSIQDNQHNIVYSSVVDVEIPLEGGDE